MTLQGAMLFVKDLEGMTAFYAEVLGLSVVPESRAENWVEFQSNGSRFSLHAIPSPTNHRSRITNHQLL